MLVTTGTFDIPHAGHVSFLRKARALAGITGSLKIGVLLDREVEGYKGKRPLYTQEERREALRKAGFRFVFAITTDQTKWLREQIAQGAKGIVVGSDWSTRNYHAQIGIPEEELRAKDVTLMFVPYTDTISTSDIRERVLLRHQEQMGWTGLE